SCSDKIALKQCTSLLSSLTSLLIDPSNAYIDSLVLPESQYSAPACQRAFSDRMKTPPLHDMSRPWRGGYRFAPLRVETTEEEFALSRRAVTARAAMIAPSNLAAVWTGSGAEETLLGGVLQGRKPSDEKGASATSRRRMWMTAEQVAAWTAPRGDLQQCLRGQTYGHVKDCERLAERRLVKQHVRQSALAGWTVNQGDAGFSIGFK
ncbi:hypothetical protein E4U41_000236, partial [Claviceps citrina]